MTVIFSPTEQDVPFVWTSTGYAIGNLSSLLPSTKVIQCQAQQWRKIAQSGCIYTGDRQEFYNKDIDILIFEGTYGEINSFTISELRKLYPNAKIVCLSSDACGFIADNRQNGYQVSDIKDVDVILELMPTVKDEYENRGFKNVDLWVWSASKSLLDILESTYQYNKDNWDRKTNDFISVLGPWTIKPNSYRGDMVDHIRDNGYTFSTGGGTGHKDPNVAKIFRTYLQSWINLGTSSHNNPAIQYAQKGWRNWISPSLGTIYVDDDRLANTFDQCMYVPTYEYGKFDEMIYILNYYKHIENRQQYKETIEQQLKWVHENTIENQLIRLFKKWSII